MPPSKSRTAGLLVHIRKFLLELGAGFAFSASRLRLEVDGEESLHRDLLFYHLASPLPTSVVDLKVGRVQTRFAGKMNFYLSSGQQPARSTPMTSRRLG